MLWVLWDIVLPLIATFLLGLFIGWLLWRWRRSRIDADRLSELRRSSARYKADLERMQQSNIELSDRLQAANGAGGGDLVSARKRIDMLAEELKTSRREVAELKTQGRGSHGTGVQSSGRRSTQSSPTDVAGLQAKLQSAQGRITALENTSNSAAADLRREIEARDRMIATLKTSLEQFGEEGDTTALLADVALRDRKIDELEARIATMNRSS